MSECCDVEDFIVMVVPSGTYTQDELIERLNEAAMRIVSQQYRTRQPRALMMGEIDWLITADVEAVRSFQLLHECPACRAGHDQALARVREHPDQAIAMANLHYTEVWT